MHAVKRALERLHSLLAVFGAFDVFFALYKSFWSLLSSFDVAIAIAKCEKIVCRSNSTVVFLLFLPTHIRIVYSSHTNSFPFAWRRESGVPISYQLVKKGEIHRKRSTLSRPQRTYTIPPAYTDDHLSLQFGIISFEVNTNNEYARQRHLATCRIHTVYALKVTINRVVSENSTKLQPRAAHGERVGV